MWEPASGPASQAWCRSPEYMLKPMMKNAPRRSQILAWLILAFAWMLASGAQAAPSVRVSLSGAAPFSAAELDAAVRARVPVASQSRTPASAVSDVSAPTPSPPEAQGYLLVEVTPAGPHAVLVRAGSKAQRVEVGDRSGTAAARIVALVIADLIVDEMVPSATVPAVVSPEPKASAQVHAPPASAPGAPVFEATSTPRSHGGLRIAATAGASKGIGTEEKLCFRAEVDAGRPLVGRLVVGGTLGLGLIPRRNRGLPDELSYSSAIAGVWAGWRIHAMEVGGGPFVSPYALGGATEHFGVLTGAGCLVRLVTPLSARLRLVVASRLNGYLNRIHVTWPGRGGFATPRFEVVLTAGLAWDGTP
jgi:hypothetical protein